MNVTARIPTLDGSERGQLLSRIRTKTIYCDFATSDEIQGIIDTEYPGSAGGKGAYYLDGEPSNTIIAGKDHECRNWVLKGTARGLSV